MNRLKRIKKRMEKRAIAVPASKPKLRPKYGIICEVWRVDKMTTFAVSKGTQKYTPESLAKTRALWRLKKILGRKWKPDDGRKNAEFELVFRRVT